MFSGEDEGYYYKNIYDFIFLFWCCLLLVLEVLCLVFVFFLLLLVYMGY